LGKKRGGGTRWLASQMDSWGYGGIQEGIKYFKGLEKGNRKVKGEKGRGWHKTFY